MKKAGVMLAAGAALLVLAAGAQAQHGTTSDHLLGSGAFGNIELVSTLDLTDTADLVADVAVSPDGKWAFLANWGVAKCNSPNEAGGQNNPDAGAWVVDISDLEDPQLVGFIASSQDTRPGEGMQVVNITTAQFTGDVLVMNNEQCGKNGKGGISLFDVTDPTKPKKLSEHFGDRGGISMGDTNDIHSSFAWDTGDRAYAVMVDNFETADVDILDVTNPRRPRLIREIDLDEEFEGLTQEATIPGLNEVFLHDMTVKKIGDNWIMLTSYWDGGFQQLNVNDPKNPTLVGDTDYTNPDPELLESSGGAFVEPPEGNGHQAEFTSNDAFFIGTDEDAAAHDVDEFEITTGLNAGPYPANAFGWTVPIVELPDGILNGPTAYGGYGCPDGDAASIPAPSVVGALAPGEEAILVLQRGPVGDPSATFEACFFSEKVEQAQLKGWDAVIIANHHAGAAFGANPNGTLCGSKGHEFTVTIPGLCLGHRAFHLLFNTPESYTYPDGPTVGALGEDVEATGLFNGFGYVHLFGNSPVGGKFPELDTYAIEEAQDPAFAFNSGDLSVHEVATDPQSPTNAYLAYYNGGFRSIEIQGGTDLVEVGGYLDENGNDFWGVEAFVRDGTTYILGSDRDDGLWIFKRN